MGLLGGVVVFEQDCGSEYVEMCKGANLGLGLVAELYCIVALNHCQLNRSSSELQIQFRSP